MSPSDVLISTYLSVVEVIVSVVSFVELSVESVAFCAPDSDVVPEPQALRATLSANAENMAVARAVSSTSQANRIHPAARTNNFFNMLLYCSLSDDALGKEALVHASEVVVRSRKFLGMLGVVASVNVFYKVAQICALAVVVNGCGH